MRLVIDFTMVSVRLLVLCALMMTIVVLMLLVSVTTVGFGLFYAILACMVVLCVSM